MLSLEKIPLTRCYSVSSCTPAVYVVDSLTQMMVISVYPLFPSLQKWDFNK